jgi:hypothetical protein
MTSFLAESSKVVQKKIGALCLPTTTLTTNYYALAHSETLHPQQQRCAEEVLTPTFGSGTTLHVWGCKLDETRTENKHFPLGFIL